MEKTNYQSPVTSTVTFTEQTNVLTQSPQANQLPGLEFQDPVIW